NCRQHTIKILGYRLFPGIAFIARVLLDPGVFVLEFLVRPPWLASLVFDDGFGKQQITVLFQRIDIDAACRHRPEPAAAGLVAQVNIIVRGADEHTLPWLDDFGPAKEWAIAFSRTADETLEL